MIYSRLLNLLLFQLITLTLTYSQPTVLIDPGHGDLDVGAIGDCVQEKVINLEEGLALYEEINNDQYNPWLPYITRDSDDDFYELYERYQMANNYGGEWEDIMGNAIPANGVDFFLSIHNNAGSESAHGTEVLYNPEVKPNSKHIKSRNAASVCLVHYINETKQVFLMLILDG